MRSLGSAGRVTRRPGTGWPAWLWLSVVRRALVAVGLLLVAGGLAAGLVPVRAHGVYCGSAWRGSDAPARADLAGAGRTPEATWTGLVLGTGTVVQDDCTLARAGARLWIVPLLPLGVLIVLAAVLVPGRRGPVRDWRRLRY